MHIAVKSTLASVAVLCTIGMGSYYSEKADAKWKNFMHIHKCQEVISLPGNVDIPLSATSHVTHGVTFSSPKVGYACDDGHLYWANKRS